jgi:hypothetical protein
MSVGQSILVYSISRTASHRAAPQYLVGLSQLRSYFHILTFFTDTLTSRRYKNLKGVSLRTVFSAIVAASSSFKLRRAFVSEQYSARL